jgi:hypothetical protein
MEGLRKEERKRLESAVASSGTLDLSHVGLTLLDWSWIWRQTGVKRVLLDHNELSSFKGPNVEEASRLTALELVDVSFNKLECVDDEGLWLDHLALKETIVLNLENNRLSSLAPSYCTLLWSRPVVSHGRKYKVHPMHDMWARSVNKSILTLLRLKFAGNEQLMNNLLACTGGGVELDPELLFDFWFEQCCSDDEVERKEKKPLKNCKKREERRGLEKARAKEMRAAMQAKYITE